MILLQSGRVPLPRSSKEDRVKASLCPTMDLIAFAGGGSPHVIVYRSIDWEKLFTTSCTGSSGSLAWRPDGKELAVGTSSGGICILKTETGQDRDVVEESSARGHACAVTCLYWTGDRVLVQQKQDEEKQPDDDEDDLPSFVQQETNDSSDDDTAFPRPARIVTGPEGMATDMDPEEEDENRRVLASTHCDASLLGGKTLDVLVAGDAQGVVSINAFGHFVIGVLDLSACFGSSEAAQVVTVSHVFLSSDLHVLVVILRRHVPSENVDEYRLCTVSTSLLARSRKQVALVASEFIVISQDVSRLRNSLTQASRIWEDGVLSPLKKLLVPLLEEEEFNSSSSLGEDRRQLLDSILFDLLVRGVFKSSWVKFFTKTTDVVLTRFLRTLEGACDTVVRLMDFSSQRSCESLIFRIGDLVGRAQADENFSKIGVTAQMLVPYLTQCEALLLSVRRVRALAGEAKQDFSALYRWLVGCRKRWSSSASVAVLEAVAFTVQDSARIERMLNESDLEHQILSKELGIHKYKLVLPKKAAVASWDRDFQAEDEENEAENERRHDGLAAQVAHLEEEWKQAGPMVRDTMSESFVPIESRELFEIVCDQDAAESDQKIALGGNSTGRCDLAFVDPADPTKVSLSSMDAARPQWQPRGPELSVNDSITHVEFCTDTPGRKSTVNDSLLCVIAGAATISIIGWDEGEGKMTSLKQRSLYEGKQVKIHGVASSGPRGVACAMTENRKFELYDIAHDEDENSVIEEEEGDAGYGTPSPMQEEEDDEL